MGETWSHTYYVHVILAPTVDVWAKLFAKLALSAQASDRLICEFAGPRKVASGAIVIAQLTINTAGQMRGLFKGYLLVQTHRNELG